jgi:hypothetical protein
MPSFGRVENSLFDDLAVRAHEPRNPLIVAAAISVVGPKWRMAGARRNGRYRRSSDQKAGQQGKKWMAVRRSRARTAELVLDI